jgi:hypothetical protein
MRSFDVLFSSSVVGIAMIHMTTAAPTAVRAEWSVVVARGTVVRVRLDRSLSTTDAARGDVFSLVVAAPVTIEDRVVIPAGTIVDAVLDGNVSAPNGEQRVDLTLLLTRLEYPGGDVLDLRRDEVVATATLRGASEYHLAAGSSIELVLQTAFTVEDRLTVASAPRRRAPSTVVAEPAQTCWSPGSPGTPDIVIPGTPPTPPIGDTPGLPGTPDIIVPGIPATPARVGPCP